jgi:membrane protease YdiL (CAAX protease family)
VSEQDFAANPYYAPAPSTSSTHSAPAATAAAPAAGSGEVEYQQLHRAGRQPAWAWSLLGLLAVAVCFILVNAIVATVGAVVIYLASGTPTDELEDKVLALADADVTTPASLLFVHVVLILAIPEVWAVVRLVNGLRPGWLTSIAPRVRWGWFAMSFGVSIVTFVVTILLGALMPSSADADLVSGGLNEFTSTTRDFLLVIVLLTPFQAIAEEYVFRGYLTQVFGSMTARLWVSRAVAVLVPALLFAFAHGAQDFPVFVDRLAFGLVAGILVIATGGLEAAMAYHIVNNLLAFGLTLAYGDMSGVLSPEGGSWWDVLLSVVKSVVFVALSLAAARMMRLRTRADRTVLDASVGRV